MTTTTIFKRKHAIPMDKMTFDKIPNDPLEAYKNNYKSLNNRISYTSIEYDEELQIASFKSSYPFSIEQGSEYIIITINTTAYLFSRLPNRYLINKRTGDIYENGLDQIKHRNDLMDGLMRVYHRSKNELLELDFISDELKKGIELQRRHDEDNNDDSDDDGYDDVFSR